jgi:citrate/tricarballylate utilization protein
LGALQVLKRRVLPLLLKYAMTEQRIHITPKATPATDEAARVMGICNSCRYCEGFCAVFPAMERRLSFTPSSIHFLANLCHNCGACYHSCQYAPPHAFALEVPKALGRVRKETYAQFATPPALGALYQNQGLALVLASIAGFMTVMVTALAFNEGSIEKLFSAASTPALFYEITPHNVLVALFLPVFAWALIAMARSGQKYWRSLSHMAKEEPFLAAEAKQTFLDIAQMRYLDGGGEGCTSANDQPTKRRRVFHQLIFLGFMLCFAATSVATFYHYALNMPAPYPLLSLPKLLGVTGGVMMVIGCVAALIQRPKRHQALTVPEHRTMDVGFVVVLLLIAASGLVSMVLRTTAAMPLLHIFHLSTVLAFFLLMPYSKFTHGVYRGLALWWHNREQRNPSRLQLSEG